MKKIVVLIAAILLLVSVVLCLLPFRQNVNESYRLDTDTEGDISIVVEGVYYSYLFGNDCFKGTLTTDAGIVYHAVEGRSVIDETIAPDNQEVQIVSFIHNDFENQTTSFAWVYFDKQSGEIILCSMIQ